jgi:hypothetical protein
MHRVRPKVPVILFIQRRRLAIQEDSSLLRATGGSGSCRSMIVPSSASRHYGTYTRRGGLTAILRIKLMEVLYVPWIMQWFSILHNQADTSRVADLDHSEGALPVGGELVSTISSEHSLEHQIIHLELSATHEPLLVVFECLAVPCIFYSRLSSSLIDEVDIFTPELVLCGFVICMDT